MAMTNFRAQDMPGHKSAAKPVVEEPKTEAKVETPKKPAAKKSAKHADAAETKADKADKE